MGDLQKVVEALLTHASQWTERSLICIPGPHEQQEIKLKIDQNSLCGDFFLAFLGRWTQMFDLTETVFHLKLK